MSDDTAIISMMRQHEGGLGSFLTDQEKQAIRDSHSNHPENTKPIDMEKFLASADDSFKSMPLTMLEQR